MTSPEHPGAADTADPSVNILLVEDDIDQRELTIEALSESMPHARVTEAKDGPTALDLLRNTSMDVIILDFSLPGMNGLEVLHELGRRDSGIPVIMVTGQGDETIAVEAMKNGAQDYIIKARNYLEALPLTIERTVTQNSMKRELEEASLRGRRLYELSLAAAKERKVDALTESLVNGAAQLIGTEESILFLADADGNVGFVKSHGIDVDATHFAGPLKNLGVLSTAYTANRPMVIEEPDDHPLWKSTPWLHPMLRHMLAVPLSMQGNTEGTLCVINKLSHQPFSPEDVDTLSTLAVHAGVAIDNARFVERIEQQAVTDSLTGLYNHMEFQNHLTKEIDRSRRYGNAFSLLMLDIDHFKLVNDSYGHQMGDTVLKEIVKTVHGCLRCVDKVFRYGGEEFAVILPETSKEGAKLISERILQAVAETDYRLLTSQPIRITVSIGVSSVPQDAQQREQAIDTADQALFAAKRGGRNRVVVFSEGLGSFEDYGNIRLEEYLCDPQMMVLRDLAAVNNARCRHLKGHTDEVYRYAMRFADALNLNEDDRNNLEFAGLLHNLGSIGVTDEASDSGGSAGATRRDNANADPSVAQLLIRQTQQLESALRTIVLQHERYDGHGYPNGLKGEEIPYLSRVLAVVVAYHAMTSQRTPGLSRDQAIEELRSHAGTRFDPDLVGRFITMLERKDLSLPDPA